MLLVVKWAWLIILLKFIKMWLMAGACGTILFQDGSFCNFLWCSKCCMKRERRRQQENCIVDYPHRNSKPAGLMFLCAFVHVCCSYYGIHFVYAGTRIFNKE